MKYKQNKRFLLLACFFCAVIIFILDYLTGSDIRISVFYYFLVYLITFNFGRNWGITFLVLSVIEGISIRFLIVGSSVAPSAVYWNTSIRLIVLAMVVYVTSRLKEGLERERKLNLQLQRTIGEVNATNKDLRSLSYSIAHDVKNPIMVISAFSDILKEAEPKLDSEQNDALSRIISETHRVNEIINDLLRLSRVGSQELNTTYVDLSDIASTSVEELRGVYSDTKYDVNVQPKMFVNADPGLIRILMDNLIGNAMKFTIKSDSPKIRVGISKQNGEEVYYVKDNGAGFEQEKSNKIFEPFVRLHTAKDFPGTGIGLAIVEKIIKRYNGQIWAVSEPGNGTTFYFTLLKKKV